MNLSEVHDLADAVVLVWYPGEEGGNAVADIIFGKASPSGRLPVTFPKSFDQLPPYEDYSMKGRTYRYMTAEPMYPFGYGLSYTQFTYSPLTLSAQQVKKNTPVTAATTLTNTGKIESEEVVELYITVPQTGNNPQYSLKGIKRVKLKPGESQKVTFAITPELMKSVNDNGESVLLAGNYQVSIGGSVPSQRSLDLGAAKPAQGSFVVK